MAVLMNEGGYRLETRNGRYLIFYRGELIANVGSRRAACRAIARHLAGS